jgi:hypothetical protein
VLAQATAASLGRAEPAFVARDVSVMLLQMLASNQPGSMQILCLASDSTARTLNFRKWPVALARAWVRFAEDRNISWQANVGIWPTLQTGTWVKATEDYLCRHLPLKVVSFRGIEGSWVKASEIGKHFTWASEEVWSRIFDLCVVDSRFIRVVKKTPVRLTRIDRFGIEEGDDSDQGLDYSSMDKVYISALDVCWMIESR